MIISLPFFQRIRSKMDIRADYVPKAFKTEVTSMKYEKTESGSFNIVRGEVVSPVLYTYAFVECGIGGLPRKCVGSSV